MLGPTRFLLCLLLTGWRGGSWRKFCQSKVSSVLLNDFLCLLFMLFLCFFSFYSYVSWGSSKVFVDIFFLCALFFLLSISAGFLCHFINWSCDIVHLLSHFFEDDAFCGEHSRSNQQCEPHVWKTKEILGTCLAYVRTTPDLVWESNFIPSKLWDSQWAAPTFCVWLQK